MAASTLFGRIIILIGGVLRMALLIKHLNLLRILLEALVVFSIDDNLRRVIYILLLGIFGRGDDLLDLQPLI